MNHNLKITNPKRGQHAKAGWEGFFPYYAGFPEAFVTSILTSAGIRPRALVFDPWNGSGTTTFAASQLGLAARGYDINPVMVIVARARLLSPYEVDSIEPLAGRVTEGVRTPRHPAGQEEPLTIWFATETAGTLRAVERSIRRHLVGEMTLTPEGPQIGRISGLAATFYAALFSVCRSLTARFRSSNPTWTREPKRDEERIWASKNLIIESFRSSLSEMALALSERLIQGELPLSDSGSVDLRLADTVKSRAERRLADLVLTSPPYCTRIDYAAATRVELALIDPLIAISPEQLSRHMIGSTRVPLSKIQPRPDWGTTCNRFLAALRGHPSKASGGYYYNTHLDYFDKMHRSLGLVSGSLKRSGVAVLVVQDSYYKDIHNNLPTIISEMGESRGLRLRRREDFYSSQSMSGINPHTRIYNRAYGATEAVLCFGRNS